MSDAVFVSYKREDRARVEPLVRALRDAGLAVWWDGELEGGSAWRAAIADRLAAARCVLVVWSRASVGPEAAFVHDEADHGRRRRCLLPVQIDAVAPPLGFGGLHSLPLLGWGGDAADPRCAAVIAAARAMVQGGRVEAPPVPPRRARRTIALAATLAIGGGVLAGVLAWHGRADPAEAAAWGGIAAGDCDALARYLARHPEGAHAAQARQRLAAAQQTTDTAWDAKELRLPIFVPAGAAAAATPEAAQAQARRRGDDDAARACAGLRAGDNRLGEVRHGVTRWDCRQRPDGHACAFDGEAICAIQVPRTVRRSVCP